jgi:hypothetical protein
VSLDVELAVCQLREAYPKWSARRIAHELAFAGSSTRRAARRCIGSLAANGPVNHQVQVQVFRPHEMTAASPHPPLRQRPSP